MYIVQCTYTYNFGSQKTNKKSAQHSFPRRWKKCIFEQAHAFFAVVLFVSTPPLPPACRRKLYLPDREQKDQEKEVWKAL